MHCRTSSSPHPRSLGNLFGATLITGALLALAVPAAAQTAAAGAKPTSSCVACHTDLQKLQAEAAKVPVKPGSALQAGKG
jgi:hypothetical protein